MSSAQRAAASKLAKRYASTFGIPDDTVKIIYLPDEDAIVYAPGFPEWSLGGNREEDNDGSGSPAH